MSWEYLQAMKKAQMARTSAGGAAPPVSPRYSKPVQVPALYVAPPLPNRKTSAPPSPRPQEEDDDEQVPDYAAMTMRSGMNIFAKQVEFEKKRLADLEQEEKELDEQERVLEEQFATSPKSAFDLDAGAQVPLKGRLPPPPTAVVVIPLDKEKMRITRAVAALPPPPMAGARGTVIRPSNSGSSIMSFTAIGSAPASMTPPPPPRTVHSGSGSSGGEERLSDSRSSPGVSSPGYTPPERSSSRPLGASTNTDMADCQTQLESLKLAVGNRVCRRGWCCWRSNAPCRGRVRAGSTLSRSSQASGYGADGKGYTHHADEEIIADNLRTQMEYATAVCFLEGCQIINITQPRLSDDLLEYMDDFVKSRLRTHPNWTSSATPVKDTAMNRELRGYLESEENRQSLHICHGVLILAGIYARVIKLEELLGCDSIVISVPVYVCEEDAYTMVLRQAEEKKELEKLPKKKDKKPSALSRLFSPRMKEP
jgi:hypothetical protein